MTTKKLATQKCRGKKFEKQCFGRAEISAESEFKPEFEVSFCFVRNFNVEL